MKADPDVKLAIESSIYRESQWLRKSSTVVKCKEILEKLSETEHIPTVDNCPNVACSTVAEVPELKKAANAAIAENYLDYWNEVAKDLIVQGDFLRLLAEEEANMTWQSFKYSLPKGVVGWAARAATNSLATPDNLFRWGKRVDSSCKLCQSTKCTLFHILNNCKVAVGNPQAGIQSRYGYRHDSILNYMSQHITSTGSTEVYVDIEGKKINGGTIPADILTTLARSDLVIINRSASPPEIFLCELTVAYESATSGANQRKENRYAGLVTDIESRGFKCTNINFEIGSRGYIDNRNKLALGRMLKLTKSKCKFATFYKNISKISVLCSYAIFAARNEPEWISPRFLQP